MRSTWTSAITLRNSSTSPRHLRSDPWLGPFIYNKPMVLHDSSHWFDYNQAATGAQFLQPDNVLARSRILADKARQAWMEMSFSNPPATTAGDCTAS